MKKYSTGFAIRWALISLATIFVAGAFYKAGFVKTAWITYTNLDTYKNLNANANIKVYDEELVKAGEGNFDFIKKRIEIDKADINARDKYGQTALQLASSYGQKQIVEYLIAHGANLKQSDNMNRLPLHWADNAEIADIFIKEGVPVDVRDKENNTPLIWAARRGKHGLVEYLLNNGADINAVDNNGESAIMWATYNWIGFPDVVRLLIERGADLDITNNGGAHLLDFAESGREEIKEMLLAAGAKRSENKKQYAENKTLCDAVHNNNVDIVEEELKKGIDPNKTCQGYHVAPIKMGARPIIDSLLLKYGANSKEYFAYGRDIIAETIFYSDYFDKSNSNKDITRALDAIKIFIEKGAELKEKHLCAAKSKEIVSLLILQGLPVRPSSCDMAETEEKITEDKPTEIQENIATEDESNKPEDAQKSSSYSYSDYENICKDSYNEENKKYVFKQYYNQDQPFEENGVKYKNIFYAAAAKHDNDLLKCLLEGTQKTVKVFNNIISGDIKEQIKNAIINNNKEELNAVLKDNPMALNVAVDISVYSGYDYLYYTPLSFAVKQNNKKIAEFLLEQGADIEGRGWDCGKYSNDTSNCEYDTETYQNIIGFIHPLQEAVNNEELEMVKFLVAKGADANSSIGGTTEAVGWEDSAFSTALKFTDKSIVKYLIENGAKPSYHAKEYLPLELIRNKDMEALEIMHSFGFDWDGQACFEGGDCHFYFEFAIETKDKKFIEYFLSHVDAAAIKKILYSGMDGLYSFLEMPCNLMEDCCDNRDIIKLLFDKGIIEPNQRCDKSSLWRYKYNNKTMLMFLQENRPEETELIDLLIQKGAKPKGNPEDLIGQMNHAAKWKPNPYRPSINGTLQDQFTEINSLIENGADINLKDKDGKTALDYAATQEMKDFLISIGAKNDRQEAE